MEGIQDILTENFLKYEWDRNYTSLFRLLWNGNFQNVNARISYFELNFHNQPIVSWLQVM